MYFLEWYRASHITAYTGCDPKLYESFARLNIGLDREQKHIVFTRDNIAILHDKGHIALHDFRTRILIRDYYIDATIHEIVAFRDDIYVITNNGLAVLTSDGCELIRSMRIGTVDSVFLCETYCIIDTHEDYIKITADVEDNEGEIIADSNVTVIEGMYTITGCNSYYNIKIETCNEVTIDNYDDEGIVKYMDSVYPASFDFKYNMALGFADNQELSTISHLSIDEHELKLEHIINYSLYTMMYGGKWLLYTTPNHPNHLVIYHMKKKRIASILYLDHTIEKLYGNSLHFGCDFLIQYNGAVHSYTLVKGKAVNNCFSMNTEFQLLCLPYADKISMTTSYIGFEDITIVT